MKNGLANWLCKFWKSYKIEFLFNISFSLFSPVFRQQAKQKESDYIFFVDADTHINDYEVLRELLALNKYVEASYFLFVWFHKYLHFFCFIFFPDNLLLLLLPKTMNSGVISGVL